MLSLSASSGVVDSPEGAKIAPKVSFVKIEVKEEKKKRCREQHEDRTGEYRSFARCVVRVCLRQRTAARARVERERVA